MDEPPVDDAVRWRVLDKTVAEVKARNSALAPEAIETAIDEALAAVRGKSLQPPA
jgi:hypothetical protein